MLLYASFVPEVNSKGMHWGCRFLLVAYPMLGTLGGVEVARRWARPEDRGGRLAIGLLLVVSLAMQLHALDLLGARKRFTAELAERVAAAPGEVVVTDVWFLAQDLAPVFYERPIFLARGPRLEGLRVRLRERGVGEVAWLMAPRGTPGAEQVSDGWLGQVELELYSGPP